MNGIVFAEGKNDIEFLTEAFYQSNFYIVDFRAEDIDPDDKSQQETRRIRDFISYHGEDALLLKSEQGKSELRETFISFLNELIGKPAFFSMVIDLDGQAPSELISELDQMTNERYDNSQISILEGPTNYAEFVRYRCEAILAGTYSDTFGLIAFHESLEEAVGIQSCDSVRTRTSKIEEYFNNSPNLRDVVLNGII